MATQIIDIEELGYRYPVNIECGRYNLQADWYVGSLDRIVLTFVGFGSSKKKNRNFMSKIVKMTGASALVVDLSGHGDSEFDINDTTPAQHVLEAVKIYDWVKSKYPNSNIYVMGTSYGGFIAAYLTRFRSVKKLVLRTPAIYEPSMFYTEHRLIDKVLVRDYRKDSVKIKQHPLFLQSALGETATLLVVHGNDESIPTQTSDAYGDIFNARRYIAEGFVHSFRDVSNPQDNVAEYYNAIVSWLKD